MKELKLKNRVLEYLGKAYPEHNFKMQNLKTLNIGQYANAYVCNYIDEKFSLTIKDFYHCPSFVKYSYGIIMARRELKALKKLSEIEGIAKPCKMLSPFCVCFSFIKGESLASYRKKGKFLPVSYFIELEKLIDNMHNEGILHLDLRNLGNILVGDDYKPYIIDFQSYVNRKFIPKFLSKLCMQGDKSGALKAWKFICSEPLNKERLAYINEANKIRKIWIFRGYPIKRLIVRLKTA